MYRYDVVVVGGGTAGVIAAAAAARTGAKTALVEAKGYLGGTVVEGGTALHSFFNSYKKFNVEKVQLVKGIPDEFIQYLTCRGACSGYTEVISGEECDSVCTAIDPELYKTYAAEFLDREGVDILFEMVLSKVVAENGTVREIVVADRNGETHISADMFVDCTGYGDLCAYAGAEYTVPGDYGVVNSMEVARIDVNGYYEYFKKYGAVMEYAERKDKDGQSKILRVNVAMKFLPDEIREELQACGMSPTVTSIKDQALSFIKIGHNSADLDVFDMKQRARALLEIKEKQLKAIEFLRKNIPGCENVYIARTSPTLNVRRGRCIQCDKDLTNEEIINGMHFEDDIAEYGYHDEFWHYSINNGGSYGIPYRALLPVGLQNVYATGMMITSNHQAHMSTRNTVSCMAQGHAAGTAAALCAMNKCTTRKLPYQQLREVLLQQNVYLGATSKE